MKTVQPMKILSFLLLLFTAIAVVSGDNYVLDAGNWGSKQEEAIADAEGTIIWKYPDLAIASVTSDNGNFEAEITASGAFTSVTADIIVQWSSPPVPKVETDEPGDDGEATDSDVGADSLITPEDEPLYFLQSWNMEAINAPEAWASDCTGKGARIAIIDGGIDPSHPDLEPNMDVMCSASFVPGKQFDEDAEDQLWHGMHVAGIAAAADNGEGIIGVAPEATIMSVKVLDGGSGSFGSIFAGILYATNPAAFGNGCTEGADIINLSLGATLNKQGLGRLIGVLAKTVNYASTRGVLVISAAGNDALDLGQLRDLAVVPAESGNGLAVSATGAYDVYGLLTGTPGDPTDAASYSNYGEGTVNLAAPGGDISLAGTLKFNAPESLASTGTIPAGTASFTVPPNGETGEVVLWTDAADASGDIHDACEGGTDPTVWGKIALIHRGSCSFVDKVYAAFVSGAIAVIISNNQEGDPPGMGGGGLFPIPAVSIAQTYGTDIEDELGNGETVDVTLDYNSEAVFDQVLSLTKGGYTFAYGTSMAAPHVAGVAALIVGQNPGISLGRLKTKLYQSADSVGSREFYGQGFVNAAKACGVN